MANRHRRNHHRRTVDHSLHLTLNIMYFKKGNDKMKEVLAAFLPTTKEWGRYKISASREGDRIALTPLGCPLYYEDGSIFIHQQEAKDSVLVEYPISWQEGTYINIVYQKNNTIRFDFWCSLDDGENYRKEFVSVFFEERKF